MTVRAASERQHTHDENQSIQENDPGRDEATVSRVLSGLHVRSGRNGYGDTGEKELTAHRTNTESIETRPMTDKPSVCSEITVATTPDGQPETLPSVFLIE
jgi:hypothetical protein